jgi:ABC-2 type transport system ATP-binding protein
LLETKQDGSLHQVKIKIASDASPNELLQAVLPHAQVQSFREILPSMNDIFISKVTSDASNSNTDF